MNNKLKVVLTPDEIHFGATHGILRRHKKHEGMRKDRQQSQKSSWDNEINGCLAEIAWCKMRGVYWTGLSDIKAKDGGNVEIRWTHHENTGGLIIYNNDSDDTRFVLAEGYPPEICFVGWLNGKDAKKLAVSRNGINIVPRESLNLLN
jgi:hypothetical protein